MSQTLRVNHEPGTGLSILQVIISHPTCDFSIISTILQIGKLRLQTASLLIKDQSVSQWWNSISNIKSHILKTTT